MKRAGVTIKNNALFINGKPEYIYSGEMHYFRIKKKDWQDRIKKAKKANLNTISSYIPWRWHELKENKFDFKGKTFPERNLIYFLDLLKKEKIYFIARIGPICHGEMIDDGLPEWMFPNYPDIRLKNYAGRTNPYSSLIDYHHADYHRLIKKWYSKLIPILKNYLITNGGPIILIQLDNEISMLNWLTQSPTYTKESNKLFKAYFKGKFKDIKILNKKFKTNYKSFQQIKQPSGDFDFKKGALLFEWEEYYREFYALYYKKLNDYFNEHNISLPVIANIPQIYDYDVKGRGNMGIMTTSMFKKFPKYVSNIIFGGAYQYRRLDYENFTDVSAMTEIIRLITPDENPMICCEMQTGVMFDRPVLYPSDVSLNIKTSLATGLNGINGYMFAGGENFLNMGGFGNYHNWQAAVGACGNLAAHYNVIKEAGEIIKNFAGIITRALNVHEINIGLYLPYYQTEYLKGDLIQKLMSKRDQKFFDGLLRLIRLAGYNYRFIDLKDIENEKLSQLDNLWIFSLEFMDCETQKKIADFIKKGKKVFFYPTIPEYDLNYQKCDAIKKLLNIKNINHKDIGANKIKKPGNSFLYYGGDEVYMFQPASEKNIKPLFYTEDNNLTALKMDINKSKVILCGFDLTHKFDFQIDFIESFAKILGIKKEIQNNNNRINAILRRGKADILFAANYTEITENTKINLKTNPFPVDFPVTMQGRTSCFFMTNFKIDNDLTLYFISSEIVKLRKSEKEVTLHLKGIEDVTLCYTGKYKLMTKEKIKVLKDNKKYKLIKIFPKTERYQICFRR